jgi:hypothetical protein
VGFWKPRRAAQTDHGLFSLGRAICLRGQFVLPGMIFVQASFKNKETT